MIANVPVELDGERLDKVVAKVASISRSQAHSLVLAGEVRVGSDIEIVPSTKVLAGARLEFELPDRAPGLTAEPVEFDVSFEDEFIAIVNKPAGIVTHPGAGNMAGTLAAGVTYRWPQIEGVGEAGRWGIVHRLDKGTSGLLAVAKTTESMAALKKLVARRQLDRRYLALVDGIPEAETGTIEAPIERDPSNPVRRRVGANGKPARTHYRMVASWLDVALLELTLDTGRTHQIRVHLAAIGHPVVGDGTYGGSASELGRPWLHSWQLSFPHPVSGELVEATAPLPADLMGSLSALGEPIAGALVGLFD